MAASDSFDDQYVLQDGANIAVIGGGPTGSFFSIFALKMARMLGKQLNIIIFEPKDFEKDGPGGCNRCGGIISELLVQTLAVEGINLPETVVRKGIDSYKLHTDHGSVSIATPNFERTIATVYRGGGPRGALGEDKKSFDGFLLEQALKEGANHRQLRIERVEYENGRPVLYSRGERIMVADLVVGAFGVNSKSGRIFGGKVFEYEEPRTVTAYVSEIRMDEEVISECFANSIQLFLVPDREIEFAAMIPKGKYVTLCILGEGINKEIADNFIVRPVVRDVLPDPEMYRIECICLPKMNVKAPSRPFSDRIVMCGDAGSTRLFKDGLGAAYLMGKSAARTAVFEGVGQRHFRDGYLPVYREIANDNYYGNFLYTVIGIYGKWMILTKAMLDVVEKEQADPDKRKILSSVLWDMFTGNERYKNIFLESLKIRMHIDMWKGLLKALIR
jgi:flavin-dependent dehydrogenase